MKKWGHTSPRGDTRPRGGDTRPRGGTLVATCNNFLWMSDVVFPSEEKIVFSRNVLIRVETVN